MKTTYVLASIFVLCCRASFALYSPDTERVDVAVSTSACQQATFVKDRRIVEALQRQTVPDANGGQAVLILWYAATQNCSQLGGRVFC